MKRKGTLFGVLLAIDLFSKYFTHKFVPKMSWMDTSYPFGGFGIFRDFLGGISLSINHVENLGAAWGMFSSYTEHLLLFRILIVFALLIYTLFFNQIPARGLAFLLIICGAIGNILGYFIYGHVIDMFHVNLWGYTFPVFNVADVCITLGIVSLFLMSFSQKHKVREA